MEIILVASMFSYSLYVLKILPSMLGFLTTMNSMVGGKEPCGKKKTVGNTVGKKQNTDDWH